MSGGLSWNFCAGLAEYKLTALKKRYMTDLTQISDETLLRWSAAGGEEAFLALYRRRQAGIYRFALHMSGSATIAEEVTQEVFMTVIRDGTKFAENRGTVAGYLFGIARNQVLKLLEGVAPMLAWRTMRWKRPRLR
jgi:Sigma-70 region 2